MKRLICLLLALTLCVLCFAGCANDEKEPANDPVVTENQDPVVTDEPSDAEPDTEELDIPVQQLTIGTASAGGAFYPIGTGLAEVITQHVEPLYVTAEITGGSVENVILTGTGECDLAISNADHVADGIAGRGSYDTAYDVNAICSLHASILHIVTLGNTGVKSVEDLKGKKVAVGPAGGGSIPMITAVLEAYGMTFDDITPTYVSYDDGITQLKDGQVDAALVGAGYKKDAWWTSPFNEKEEVREASLPKKPIELHDATLRDGEQTPGVVFTAKEKLEIAEKLVEAGVTRIEAGMPAVSESDAQAIREIAKTFSEANIFAFVRATEGDIDMAADCGAKGVIMDIVLLWTGCDRYWGTDTKTYHKKIVDSIHARGNYKVIYHCCGAIAPLLEDFIDCGYDAVNPIQLSATGMGDTAALKQKYGDRISFWGGSCDTQKGLPVYTPEQVREEVRRRVNDFSGNGGFVLCSVHNLQRDVSPENIVTLYESFYENAFCYKKK